MDTGFIKIDRSSPLPLYKQLEDRIVKAIGEGVLKTGDKLPTEDELAEAFGLSRPVVRQAYGALVGARLVSRERGRGSFVRAPSSIRPHASLLGFSQETLLTGGIPVTRVLSFGRAELPENLSSCISSAFSDAFFLERVRFTNGTASSHLKTWVPYERFPGIGSYDFTIDSLYATLFKLYGVRPTRAVRTVWASAADARTAEAMELEPGSPVIRMLNIVYDEQDELMEVGIEFYLPDIQSFTFEVHSA